jgi:hypothetical protein
MIQRVLNSKNFLAVLLALVTGTALYFKMPWPVTASFLPQTWNEYFLRLIALRDPWTYAGLKASYHVMLFTASYIGYSFLLSTLLHLYIAAKTVTQAAAVAALPGCGISESAQPRTLARFTTSAFQFPQRIPVGSSSPSAACLPAQS